MNGISAWGGALVLSVLYSYVREKCISMRSCMDMMERAKAQSIGLDAPRVT